MLFHSMTSLTLPVPVVTLHLPPVTVSGTSISPVSLLTMNTLSVRSVPVTSPVSVVISISLASLCLNEISPVLRSTVIFSFTTESLNEMLPVSPVELKLLQETEVKATHPVETERSISFAESFLRHISPVLVLIPMRPDEEVPQSTFPVLDVISISPKTKSEGTVTFPVSSFILREL